MVQTGSYEYTPLAMVKNSANKLVPFLHHSVLQTYSCKFDKILKNILNTEDGIVFVYTEYINSGAIPFALMLEQNGFTQKVIDKDGKPVIKSKLDSRVKEKHPSLYAKWSYVLLDGDVDAKRRNRLVQMCNSPDNKNGEQVKVIIGTRVAGEGVDFQRIRQIHIMNPWDNFGRIDQTIGRGIRNCSHKDLPEDERDVTVFIYSSSFGPTKKRQIIETTDEKVQRRAEKKDVQMKKVEFILRSIAVDCISHLEGNRYSSDASGTRECGYQDCDKVFQCENQLQIRETDVDRDTYRPEYHAERVLQKYRQVIKSLYLKSASYTLGEMEKAVTSQFNGKTEFDANILYIVLDKMVREKTEVNDKYKRKGRLVFHNMLYSFQPIEISKSEQIPDYYRIEPLSDKQIMEQILPEERAIQKEDPGILWMKFQKDMVRKVYGYSDNPYIPDFIAFMVDRLQIPVVRVMLKTWFQYKEGIIEDIVINPGVTTSYGADKVTIFWRLLTRAIESKDMFLDKERKTIQWTPTITFKYDSKKRELLEYQKSSLVRDEKMLDFSDYPKEHCIGRLDETSRGDQEGYIRDMVFKVIDFGAKRQTLNLSGKDAKTFFSEKLADFEAILDIDDDDKDSMMQLLLSSDDYEKQVDKAPSKTMICRFIELTLRYNERTNADDLIWWIEGARKYQQVTE
jgi:hypothetical protein